MYSGILTFIRGTIHYSILGLNDTHQKATLHP